MRYLDQVRKDFVSCLDTFILSAIYMVKQEGESLLN